MKGRRGSAVLAALVVGAILMILLTMLYRKRSAALRQWKTRLSESRAQALALGAVDHGLHKLRRCLYDLTERLRHRQAQGKEAMLRFPEDDEAYLEGLSMEKIAYPNEPGTGSYAVVKLEARLLPVAEGARDREALALMLRCRGAFAPPGDVPVTKETEHRLVLQVR